MSNSCAQRSQREAPISSRRAFLSGAITYASAGRRSHSEGWAVQPASRQRMLVYV